MNGLELLVDDGTNSTTIGGLTRDDFTPVLDSTVTASGGTTTLAQWATLFSNVRSGGIQPTEIYTTETVADLYEQLLQPQERIFKDVNEMRKGLLLGTGATVLAYKGLPVIPDEKATSGVLYMVNGNFLEFYGVEHTEATAIPYRSTDIEGNEYSSLTGLGFGWTDWIKAINSWTMTGHIIFGGQFVQRNPKRSGKLTGITTV